MPFDFQKHRLTGDQPEDMAQLLGRQSLGRVIRVGQKVNVVMVTPSTIEEQIVLRIKDNIVKMESGSEALDK